MKKNAEQIIKSCFNENIQLKSDILNSILINQITEVSTAIISILSDGGKIIFAGNGGSFADSQHLAAEFISKFMIDRAALPAIALGTNSSNLSAISNDYDFKNIFSRELSALGSSNDIFIPISTSGKSKNLIEAVKTAKTKGLKIVALTGASGGDLKNLCECIKVPSENVARIQECHIFIGHLFCHIVEKELF